MFFLYKYKPVCSIRNRTYWLIINVREHRLAIKNGQSKETGKQGTQDEQLEVKTNRPSFLCGNRNEHHNTEIT